MRLDNFSDNSSFKYQWYSRNEDVSHMILKADELRKQYKDARIFSLGQSPAWIIKTIGILNKNEGVKQEIGFIPFSKSFVNGS